MMEYMLQEFEKIQIAAQIKGVSGWARLMTYPQVNGDVKLYQIGNGYGHVFCAALVKELIFDGSQLTIILKGK